MRQAAEKDVESLADIMRRSRAGLPNERQVGAEELLGYIFRDPDYDPAANMIAFDGDKPVALASAIIERMRLAAGKDDAIVDIEVVPEMRGMGIEDELIDWGLSLLRDKGIGTARFRVELANIWKLSVAKSHSFEEYYRIWDLMRRGGAPLPELRPVPGIRLERRMLKDCLEEDVSSMNDLLNEAFADHFNSVRTPMERLLNMRDVSRDLYMVTLATGTDGPAGICLTEESVEFNRQNGAKSGWVVLLGVLPRHRRTGIGKSLLADGMEWLLERGMDTINISLVAKNERAMSLYTSLGFVKETEAVWHKRPVSL